MIGLYAAAGVTVVWVAWEVGTYFSARRALREARRRGGA